MSKLCATVLVFLLVIIFAHKGECSNDYYIEGSIVLSEGDTLQGLIKPFYSYDRYIHYKETREAKRQKFSSDDIWEIVLYINEEEIVFHNFYLGKFRAGGYKVKRYSRNCWATKIYESPEIEAFLFPEKTEKLILISTIINTFLGHYHEVFVGAAFYEQSMSIGIRFPDMDEVIDIYSPLVGKKDLDRGRFKKRLKKYLINQCLAFRKEMRTNESYKLTNFKEVLDYYSEICGSKYDKTK